MEKKKIHLYPDRPEMGEDLKFAHKILAAWLEKLITDIPTPFRIALTGKLGAGKSTVIHNALDKLGKSDKYAIAYVDVWKLDHASARRSTILRVAKEFKIDLNSDRYKKLHRSMYGNVSATDDVKVIDTLAKNVAWYKQITYWFVIVLTLALFTVVYFLLKNNDVATAVPDWLKIVLGAIVSAALFLSNIISQKILQLKSTVSQAPFIGPEEFEDAFQQILEAPEVAGKKAIVVFDNIDRAPKSKTEEILTGISAFFDHSSHEALRDLIILVPFSDTANKELDQITVQKFFDAIIPMPNLMPEDLMDYTKGKLRGVEWSNEADEVAQLIDQSNLHTPRAILHFINEIIAQVSLAEVLEKETYHDEANQLVTYLPKGSISNNRVFYAKLKLCERIQSNFIEQAIMRYQSPSEAFKLENYKEATPIYEFLRATESVPEKLPESLEQFVYFKGSDLELSIPGSSNLIQAMNNRLPEEIQQYYEKEKNIESLEKLFVYNFSKNKQNQLRAKNSIFSLIEAFKIEIPSLSLRKELAKSLVKIPNALNEIHFEELKKLTPVNENNIENEFIWINLDKIYSELKKEERGTSDELEKWKLNYLINVLSQPSGALRTNLNSSDIKVEYLINQELFLSLKRDGLQKYIGQSNLQPILKFLLSKSFLASKDELENLGSAIDIGIKNSGTSENALIQDYFVQAGVVLASKITSYLELKELFSNLTFHFKNIEYSPKCSEDCWSVFKNLNGQYPHLNNLIASGESELVIFLIMLNSKTRLTGYDHLINYVRSYFNKADFSSIDRIQKDLGGWGWLTSLNEIIPVELSNIIKNYEVAKPFALSAEREGKAYVKKMIFELSELKNFSELFKLFPVTSEEKISKTDVLVELISNLEKYTYEKSKLCFECLNENRSLIKHVDSDLLFSYYLNKTSSEEELNYLLGWAKNINYNFLNLLNDYKNELEDEGNTSWDDKCSYRFYALIEGGPRRTKDFYTVFFDKAIERGIFSAKTEDVLKRVAGILLKVWRSNTGIEIDNLNSFKKGILENGLLNDNDKDYFVKELKDIAEKNNLLAEVGFPKKSFIPNLFGKTRNEE